MLCKQGFCPIFEYIGPTYQYKFFIKLNFLSAKSFIIINNHKLTVPSVYHIPFRSITRIFVHKFNRDHAPLIVN